MRVIILLTSFNYGGAEKHGFLLAEYFKHIKKFETEVWAFKQGSGLLKSACENSGIPTKIIGPLPRFGKWLHKITARTEAKKFKSFKPDIIISFNLKANLYLGFVGPLTGAKCLVWSQQTTSDCERLDPIEIEALKNFSCYISNSQHGADYLKNKFDLPSANVFFVKNGIAFKEETLLTVEQWHGKLGVEPKQYKVLMVGHMEERKDHETLIDAWRIVVNTMRKSGKEPVLLLAGKFGPQTEALHERAVDYGILPNIRFLGKVSDVNGLLRSADVFVLSSHKEGMPNVIIEAMYAEMPVIASDIPGNREAIGELNYSWLTKHGSAADLAEKILHLAHDADLRARLGKANKEFALKEYTLSKLGDDTYAIVNEIIGRRGGGKS